MIQCYLFRWVRDPHFRFEIDLLSASHLPVKISLFVVKLYWVVNKDVTHDREVFRAIIFNLKTPRLGLQNR